MMNKIIVKVNAKVLKKSFEDTYGKRSQTVSRWIQLINSYCERSEAQMCGENK